MKSAILYIRVSTDEQADKGYSQRDQDERLRRYCINHNIHVDNVIFEDHSAKTFKRPEWIRLLDAVKKRKARPEFVLFTKWDRFSRNAGDAYQMINILNGLGIEPQAVEQPLDLSVPENKMMLAIYLAAPEVENDRRALNTFYGMRRAKKEGRVLGMAPYGYINRTKEDGQKYIAIKEPEGSNIQWAFNEVGKGVLAVDQVRQAMVKRGKNISRSAFHVALRNVVYCGKVFIQKYKDEEAHSVQGQHDALISEALFYKVQDIIDGNKHQVRPQLKLRSDDNLPLRGFLVCPDCERNLTGSASKGSKGGYYYYYHCIPKCGFRKSAVKANEIFQNNLEKYEFPVVIQGLLHDIMMTNYKSFTSVFENRRRAIALEIGKFNTKLSKARELLLAEKLDADDYREIKEECKRNIDNLEEELSAYLSEQKNHNIKKNLDDALNTLSRLSTVYKEGDIETKRYVISSIYPEKLYFDGSTYRTPRVNVIARCILLINNALLHKKNRTNESSSHLSGLVAGTGLEPVTFGL
ncbi:recombinase family protein [Flavobacterium sp. LC2016-13]|uniref:recombinase family protein n=1 Tax=Flavobacterium sp. LC2016-13 TaxID=2675875 RepID=UPI0012B942F9|nr:recombinase family protein [Flavobacterium sp. LC2016-13]MTD67652.1 recombinase family protein [Flavobacterium sp. LC2016-13]